MCCLLYAYAVYTMCIVRFAGCCCTELHLCMQTFVLAIVPLPALLIPESTTMSCALPHSVCAPPLSEGDSMPPVATFRLWLPALLSPVSIHSWLGFLCPGAWQWLQVFDPIAAWGSCYYTIVCLRAVYDNIGPIWSFYINVTSNNYGSVRCHTVLARHTVTVCRRALGVGHKALHCSRCRPQPNQIY